MRNNCSYFTKLSLKIKFKYFDSLNEINKLTIIIINFNIIYLDVLSNKFVNYQIAMITVPLVLLSDKGHNLVG